MQCRLSAKRDCFDFKEIRTDDRRPRYGLSHFTQGGTALLNTP
jgi:hypothetical protein